MPLPSYVTETLNKKTEPQADGGYEDYISIAADTHDVDPDLIRAMIDTESGGNPQAVSNKGASGLMQLMPGTAKEMGVEDLTDPFQNIMGGTKYIKKLLEKFDGDTHLALAAYNAGPRKVKEAGGIPPYKETQNYIDKVQRKMSLAKEAEAGGVPDYVKEAVPIENPDWMKWHPYLAGLYGAGQGLLEQAVVPSLEAVGAIGGTIIAPWAPVASGALGYGIAASLGRRLEEAYRSFGGEKPLAPTITEEMIKSASDVGTAIVLGKVVETGARVAPHVEDYLRNSLSERLYGSAIETPMSKKWIQTLPNEVVSKQTQVIKEGLNQRVPPSKFGLEKAKALNREVETYIDDITEVLSTDPKNFVNRDAALQEGVKKARARAADSSDPVKANAYIDAIEERFKAHPANMTPEKANRVKRQLYSELQYGSKESTALGAQMDSVGTKGVAREIMLNLESIYPPLAELNATSAARIGLEEAIEKSFAKGLKSNIVPLGPKILMNPKTWPLALWEATMGHPQVKARLAFALHKANPTVYSAMP
jgi:hypothetical protein